MWLNGPVLQRFPKCQKSGFLLSQLSFHDILVSSPPVSEVCHIQQIRINVESHPLFVGLGNSMDSHIIHPAWPNDQFVAVILWLSRIIVCPNIQIGCKVQVKIQPALCSESVYFWIRIIFI